jgi:hypothetical protein
MSFVNKLFHKSEKEYSMSPVEVVNMLLSNPLDIENVRSTTTPDVLYVSLNKNNPDLTRILPWAGEHRGPEEIVKAFQGIYTMWDALGFEVKTAFGQGEDVAVFGEFTYRCQGSRQDRAFAVRHAHQGRPRQDLLCAIPRGHFRHHVQHPFGRRSGLHLTERRSAGVCLRGFAPASPPRIEGETRSSVANICANLERIAPDWRDHDRDAGHRTVATQGEGYSAASLYLQSLRYADRSGAGA